MKCFPALAVALILATSASAQSVREHEGEHHLVLTGVGRFVFFADTVSLERDAEGVKMRAFQVAEDDFEVAGQAYWGGWSWWRFDCTAHTADRLDFVAVKAGGAEGPSTPDTAPVYDAAPGGDAAELLAVACAPGDATRAVADTLDEAVRLGRAALSESDEASNLAILTAEGAPE
ncbi:hypothetical protein ACIQC9_09705 [Brevundimonas sp. NPDC092305]|uniref:hypothetical protein n=1 Tax=Brevundimonas sp. NPDC092305 TaxID=3363957 RepID=UPI0038244028